MFLINGDLSSLLPWESRQCTRCHPATLRRHRRLLAVHAFIRLLAITRGHSVLGLFHNALHRGASNDHRVLRVSTHIGRSFQRDGSRRILRQMRPTQAKSVQQHSKEFRSLSTDPVIGLAVDSTYCF